MPAPDAAPPLQIMLVDDHAVVRTGYRRLIELEAGLAVVAEAQDADTALAALQRRAIGGGSDRAGEGVGAVRSDRPEVSAFRSSSGSLAGPAVDVVVVDLSMPGRSGLDLIRRLRARWPWLPTLVFTMHDAPAMVAQALQAGAAGFITKASEPQVLVDALRRVAAGERPVLSPDLRHAPSDPQAQAPHALLSPREFQVLHGLVQGLPVEAIANALHLSAKTVSNHQTAIRQKLGVSSAVELLRYARDHGLFTA